MIETHTLENGMRVVVQHCQSAVVYCGIAVDAGTRDELPHESGMAHFTEHMSFKGTTHRRAWHIIQRMEAVGGDLNAYTGKEETVYYCTFLRPHLHRALDLLMDITLQSTYPQTEMDKEVEVVIDEIESYNDSPSELIFDEFESLIFPDHPLGRNILGEADALRQLRSEDMQEYARRLYRPSGMVLFVYGDVTMAQVLRSLGKWATMTTDGAQPLVESPSASSLTPLQSAVHRRKKDTHQAHVMMGTRCYGGNDPRHLHLYLLNNILGGPAMSSRLNMALRERNGLVYTVESSMTSYTDTGVWSVYFGCDPKDVDRCRRLVMKELRRLVEAPLSERELSAAKQQISGQIGVSWDNGENVAIGMGKRMLHYHRTQTMQQLLDSIQSVTAHDLWLTAQDIFSPNKMITLIYE